MIYKNSILVVILLVLGYHNIHASDSNDQSMIKNSCIVQDNDLFYDLSNLASRNYWHFSEIALNDTNLHFFLSLCNPLQSSKENIDGAECSNNKNDSVCFIYTPQSSRIIDTKLLKSAGKLDPTNVVPEVVQEGSLKYLFTNGSTCSRGNKALKYKTELHLQCPKSPKDETPGPILMSSPSCVFIFVWMTMSACPKKLEKVNQEDACLIKYSNSDDMLNLHSIASDTFYTPQSFGADFEVNVCSGNKKGKCASNVSICDVTDPNNPKAIAYDGDYSLKWEDKTLKLMLNKTQNNASVYFSIMCDKEAITPRIYHMNIGNSYAFNVYSAHVCIPEPSDCIIEDENYNRYDLRPLELTKGNWLAHGRNRDNEVRII